MSMPPPTMSQQVAQAASTFHQQRTGHAPKSVTVVQGERTLVITIHEALSPAERALVQSNDGAAKVKEFHKQLFLDSVSTLEDEIKRITGVDVQEASSEIQTETASFLHVFSTGTMVQVFLLDQTISPEVWNGVGEPLPPTANPAA